MSRDHNLVFSSQKFNPVKSKSEFSLVSHVLWSSTVTANVHYSSWQCYCGLNALCSCLHRVSALQSTGCTQEQEEKQDSQQPQRELVVSSIQEAGCCDGSWCCVPVHQKTVCACDRSPETQLQKSVLFVTY